MLCPLCQGEIIDGAIKCKHCGGMVTSLQQQPATPQQKPCPLCSELIHAEAIKCKFCGSMITQPPPPQQPTWPQQPVGYPPASGMRPAGLVRFEILYPGSYAMARACLQQGQTIKAESDAMVAMSPTIDIQGKMEGGVLGALGRKLLTGETAFLQTLSATRGSGEVLLAPSTPGDLQVLTVTEGSFFYVQKEGFLAGDASLTIETASQGIVKGLLSGEGIFIQRVSGTGSLVISSFGAIHKLTLAHGETMIVDNAHLVAWSGSVSYEVTRASKGLLDTITSGEGLVCHVKGPGDMYIQSRNKTGFGSWIAQFLPDTE